MMGKRAAESAEPPAHTMAMEPVAVAASDRAGPSSELVMRAAEADKPVAL